MTPELETAPWLRLEECISAGDRRAILAAIEELGARESARAISRLSIEEQNQILTLLQPEQAAELLAELPDVQSQELVRNLPAGVAGPILSEMPSDEMADVLGAMADEHAELIIQEMDAESAEDARLLSQYPGNVAGGLMLTEYLSFPESATTDDVIADLRHHSDRYANYSIQYSYVVDADQHLLGVLPLRDLLMTPAGTRIRDIMIKNPLRVYDTDTLERLSEFFDEHDFLGVPVVDVQDRLVGVLRRRDLREALGERANTDYLKSQGIVGGEELRSMPVLLRSKRRLYWLSANIVLNLFGASIIAVYQDTLAQVIALAVFLPIISDMSGCSGNQAVAVSMRELDLGLVKPMDMLHVWLKEASVGILNGFILGLLIAAVAVVYGGSAWFGLVVGGALALNTLVAVSIGGLIPLALKRMKLDPALASGPLLTTVTDMCGFFLVLSFASLLMPHLVES